MKVSNKCTIFIFFGILLLSVLSGCGNTSIDNSSAFDPTKEIHVLTREDGSGTRGAFVELFGIEQTNDLGKTIDHMTDTAAVTNSTSVMMTTIAGDIYSIGYSSLGAMNETIKSSPIDGVEATIENIRRLAWRS